MSGWLILAGVVGVPYLLAYAVCQLRDRRWRAWAEAAGVIDLVSSSVLWIRRRLAGRVGPVRVSFERYRAADEYGTRIVVDGLGHSSGEFDLRAENVGSAIKKALGAREIETGDPPFDDSFYVRGDPRVVRAILDAETRWLLRALLHRRVMAEMRRLVAMFGLIPGFEDRKARVSVSDGALRAEVPGSNFSILVAEILAAARRLVAPEDIPERLAHNARHDSRSGAQVANLLTLAREYPDHPRTRETLRELCQRSSDSEVRLRAAIELGEEGWETLRKVASSLSTEDSRAARALDALGEGLFREQAEVFLQRTLARKRLATARAAIRALGRIGGAEVVPPLVAALDEDDEAVVAAAVSALGESGAGEAEDALIGALRRQSPELSMPVAEALGRVGSARAVASLRELASRHPLDLGVRRATRQAIAEIQSRLEGATPGQLSLAEGEVGRLSLAEDDRQGWVSLSGEAPNEPAKDDTSSADRGPPRPGRGQTE